MCLGAKSPAVRIPIWTARLSPCDASWDTASPSTRACCRSRFVRQDASSGKPCVQLSMWCMNPGCSFKDIGQKARSVIVTSGTLSPMISFASELGIPFPGTPLTTGHVVPQDQVRFCPMQCQCSLRNQPRCRCSSRAPRHGAHSQHCSY